MSWLLGELTVQCVSLQSNKSEQNQVILKSPLATNLPFLLQQLYPGWSNYIPQTSFVIDCSQSPFFCVRSSRRRLPPQYIWPPVPINPRSWRSYEKNRGLWTVYVGHDGNLAQRCLLKIPNCIIWTIQCNILQTCKKNSDWKRKNSSLKANFSAWSCCFKNLTAK